MSCSFSLSRTLVLGSLGNSFELYLCDMIKIIDEMHHDSIADDAAETLMFVSSLFEGNDDPTLNYYILMLKKLMVLHPLSNLTPLYIVLLLHHTLACFISRQQCMEAIFSCCGASLFWGRERSLLRREKRRRRKVVFRCSILCEIHTCKESPPFCSNCN